MSLFYVVLAFLVAFSQRSHASFEHMHGLEAVPVVEHVPAVAAAPVMAAAPVVAAAPAPVMAAAPIFPYEHEHHYHPPAEVHNHVSSFHREAGHLSDTDMMLPFKARRLAAAKKARMHKKAHKKN